MLNDEVIDIVPYVSVGPIQFGENESNASKAFGGNAKRSKNRKGEVVLDFGDVMVTFAQDDGVVEVSVVPPAHATIQGVEIFTDRNVLNELVKLNQEPVYECFGFLVFLNLGVAITGLHDNERAQAAVSAFREGRWQNMRSHFKLYRQ